MTTPKEGPNKNNSLRGNRTAVEKEKFCNNMKYLSEEGMCGILGIKYKTNNKLKDSTLYE